MSNSTYISGRQILQRANEGCRMQAGLGRCIEKLQNFASPLGVLHPSNMKVVPLEKRYNFRRRRCKILHLLLSISLDPPQAKTFFELVIPNKMILAQTATDIVT